MMAGEGGGWAPRGICSCFWIGVRRGGTLCLGWNGKAELGMGRGREMDGWYGAEAGEAESERAAGQLQAGTKARDQWRRFGRCALLECDGSGQLIISG